MDITALALSGIFTVVFVKIAGALFHEARPFIVEHVPPLIPHPADNGFPSDHMAACGLAVAYLWTRQRALALVSLAVAAALAVARVIAKLHWPIDVAAGFALGALAVVVATTLLGRRLPVQSRR